MEKEFSATTDQVILFIDQGDGNPTPATESHSDEIEENYLNPSRTRTLRRLNFSRPKSRLSETSYSHLAKPDDPLSTDEDDQIYEGEDTTGEIIKHPSKEKNVRWGILIEWVLFIVIITALICSLTVESVRRRHKYGIPIWKWCFLMMAIVSGHLISGWVARVIVFFIERNYVLRERVLYFVYGLQKGCQTQLWLGLVLFAWSIIFNRNEISNRHVILQTIFKLLTATLVGATIWLFKILGVKMLASSFHVSTFFDRMKESVFHHYILEMLSGPPLVDEMDGLQSEGQQNWMCSKSIRTTLRQWRNSSVKRADSRKIDIDKLRKLSMESTASPWTVKRLVNCVRYSGLSSITKTVENFDKAESEISSESEAKACAQRTFKNIAKTGAKYIEEEDLLRFLRKEEVHTIFPFFEGAMATGHIKKSAFRDWVVQAYQERKVLACSLNDSKTAVHQLHKLASAVVTVVIVVMFLLVMGLATSKVMLVITSQLLLVGFMFQNTCKTVFESIIFVFIMHPFDVGDRCVIDGVQMVVEEMNILTTVFLRYDNEKIFYPNSVLSTKPISNFYRSPEMSDAIDFTIDVSTPVEKINAIKKHIQVYIESKPTHWNPKHSVIFKEIENVDKMKMALCVMHTMNHQNYGEKSTRRSELVFELKKIFGKLEIKYHLLPQEVHLTRFEQHMVE